MHKFIHAMVRRNTVNAVFRNADVYSKGASKEGKKEFKHCAKKWLAQFGERYSRRTATRESWVREIEALKSHLGANCGRNLTKGQVTLGIAQKMISLYLKYRWLLGEADKKPLYAVVDRQILKAIRLKNAPAWTTLDDQAEYKRVVDEIDRFAKSQNAPDGATWEADFWRAADDEEDEE